MRQSENDIVVLLPKLRLELDNLKKSQIVGANNLLIFDNQTASPFDDSVSLSTAESTELIVTFDADNQDFAFTELVPVVYLDTVGSLTDITYPSFSKTRMHVLNTVIPKRTIFSFIFTSLESGTHTFYIKYHVLSVDTGTVS